ncbi:BLUF domain-containing protein [Algibacter pectinivorans]|uniref:Sensors of blue-light using FAD n=1 Tax=Algibacter pectinivorans TaxID=870482 RepID=A0A1I1PZT2_9FLAO|nr:BLUF domain-containing protein [Algibacter pectinivorans]SFD15406.1 Sensors of blue-light using FAD [Algibacter pectinivorans]
MLKTICYTSKVKPNIDIMGLEALFNETQAKNNTNNITGVLVKRDSTFFQIIEGQPNLIDILFEKIKTDNRHSNILELVNNPITKLSFKDFNTNYTIIDDLDALYSLQDYLIHLENKDCESKAIFLQIIEDLLSSD